MISQSLNTSSFDFNNWTPLKRRSTLKCLTKKFQQFSDEKIAQLYKQLHFSQFTELPADLIPKILGFLHCREIALISPTCKLLSNMGRSPETLMEIATSHLGLKDLEDKEDAETKMLWMPNHSLFRCVKNFGPKPKDILYQVHQNFSHVISRISSAYEAMVGEEEEEEEKDRIRAYIKSIIQLNPFGSLSFLPKFLEEDIKLYDFLIEKISSSELDPSTRHHIFYCAYDKMKLLEAREGLKDRIKKFYSLFFNPQMALLLWHTLPRLSELMDSSFIEKINIVLVERLELVTQVIHKSSISLPEDTNKIYQWMKKFLTNKKIDLKEANLVVDLTEFKRGIDAIFNENPSIRLSTLITAIEERKSFMVTWLLKFLHYNRQAQKILNNLESDEKSLESILKKAYVKSIDGTTEEKAESRIILSIIVHCLFLSESKVLRSKLRDFVGKYHGKKYIPLTERISARFTWYPPES